jgi:phosphatidylglycerophosphate synthase
MFDERLQKGITPALQWLARRLVRWQIQANSLTWTGFGIGVLAALAIALQHYLPGLCLILLSRLLDGLDGAVARLTTPTDSGSFLDITLDFLFYALIPLAFAVANPAANALAAATLLAGFMGTASSFLAFAVLAAKRGMPPNTALRKGFYFLGGLTEASETLMAFAAMCLWPEHFAAIAYGFAALCGLTILSRIHAGWTHFQPQGNPK